MPELPEVETVARGLRTLVVSRRIVDYGTTQPKAMNLSLDELRARGRQEIRAVDRRGKSAILRLETDHLWLHLGLQGQLLYEPPDSPAKPDPHILVALDDGSRLRMERIFMGHAHLLDPDASRKREAALGADPLLAANAECLHSLAAKKPNLGAKAALMDQALIAGVGNVYSDEALHRARLHPARKLGSMSADELARLWAAVRAVLSEAIDCGGDESYSDVFGKQGTFATTVHGRKECAGCGGPTTKQAFGGRGAYFCAACQPEA